jgi:hypothetical protein
MLTIPVAFLRAYQLLKYAADNIRRDFCKIDCGDI